MAVCIGSRVGRRSTCRTGITSAGIRVRRWGVDLFAIKNAGGGGVLNHPALPASRRAPTSRQRRRPIVSRKAHRHSRVRRTTGWSLTPLRSPTLESRVCGRTWPRRPQGLRTSLQVIPRRSNSGARPWGHPRHKMRKGRSIRLPKFTSQGAAVTWNARPKRVCKVTRYTLKAKHKGRCLLRASAPALPGVNSYAAAFVVRVR
jgi:hypothetical protein